MKEGRAHGVVAIASRSADKRVEVALYLGHSAWHGSYEAPWGPGPVDAVSTIRSPTIRQSFLVEFRGVAAGQSTSCARSRSHCRGRGPAAFVRGRPVGTTTSKYNGGVDVQPSPHGQAKELVETGQRGATGHPGCFFSFTTRTKAISVVVPPRAAEPDGIGCSRAPLVTWCFNAEPPRVLGLVRE